MSERMHSGFDRDVEDTPLQDLAIALRREHGLDVNFEDWQGLSGQEVRNLVWRMQEHDIGDEWVNKINEWRMQWSDVQ